MQPKLKIETMKVADLVPYAGNAKEHPDWQIDQIAASIEQFGMNDPVGIWHDKDGRPTIVEGHGRVLALKRLGVEECPVIALDHLDDDGRRAYVHVHNQTTLTSGFDLDVLNAELADIPGFDWEDFGFDPPVSNEETRSLEDVEETEIPVAPAERVHLGEIWKLGDHILMCGDSTNIADMAKLLRGGVVDLLLTDPPYNVAYNQNDSAGWDPEKAHQRKDRMTILNDKWSDENAFRRFIADALDAAAAHLKPGAAFYVWFAAMHTPALYGAAEDAGLTVRQELVWAKGHFTLGRQDYQWMHEVCLYGWTEGSHYFTPIRNEATVIDDMKDVKKMTKAELEEVVESLMAGGVETSVLRYAKPNVSDLHPTTKPIKLFARLILNSTKEGETVLDSFGGSGTTLMAAEQLGRKARVMELDPHYCDVIIQRWEEFTGKTAELMEPAAIGLGEPA